MMAVKVRPSPRFQVNWVTFSVVKAGNSPGENEDAVAPSEQGHHLLSELAPFRCAVSDGATTTAFSREWAENLVTAYRNKYLKGNFKDTDLQELRRYWDAEQRVKNLPWYLEEKILQGAFASLLGLTITGTADGRLKWTAVAVGDSCLFHLRRQETLTSFPLVSSEQFNDRPRLISSHAPEVSLAKQKLLGRQVRGQWHPGDHFLLMTDALAAWFLADKENQHQLWNCLRSVPIGSTETKDNRFGDSDSFDFVSFVDKLRENNRISNDDTSLLSVRVEEVGAEYALA